MISRELNGENPRKQVIPPGAPPQELVGSFNGDLEALVPTPVEGLDVATIAKMESYPGLFRNQGLQSRQLGHWGHDPQRLIFRLGGRALTHTIPY